MKFVITSIADAGDLERERVVVKATEAGDIGRYALFGGRRSTSNPKLVVSGNVPLAYWFQDQMAKDGDFIVLYTKKGKRSEKTSEDGSTSYFFYWGFQAPIWSDNAVRAVLISMETWTYPQS